MNEVPNLASFWSFIHNPRTLYYKSIITKKCFCLSKCGLCNCIERDRSRSSCYLLKLLSIILLHIIFCVTFPRRQMVKLVNILVHMAMCLWTEFETLRTLFFYFKKITFMLCIDGQGSNPFGFSFFLFS